MVQIVTKYYIDMLNKLYFIINFMFVNTFSDKKIAGLDLFDCNFVLYYWVHVIILNITETCLIFMHCKLYNILLLIIESDIDDFRHSHGIMRQITYEKQIAYQMTVLLYMVGLFITESRDVLMLTHWKEDHT